jgi:hypothetical protein
LENVTPDRFEIEVKDPQKPAQPLTEVMPCYSQSVSSSGYREIDVRLSPNAHVGDTFEMLFYNEATGYWGYAPDITVIEEE